MVREKSRQAYSESINRIVVNMIIFTQALKPRLFDAEDLLREIPSD